jgi:hypothetical protein
MGETTGEQAIRLAEIHPGCPTPTDLTPVSGIGIPDTAPSQTDKFPKQPKS